MGFYMSMVGSGKMMPIRPYPDP